MNPDKTKEVRVEKAVRDTVKALADAITPPMRGATDETGRRIESLTEAIMGNTAGLYRIAHAILPPVAGGSDATGGHIESLTEAVMGNTAGLCRIAREQDRIATALADMAEAFERLATAAEEAVKTHC